MTTARCPRCRKAYRQTAKFCGFCGLSLSAGSASAGRVPHPHPKNRPAGFAPVEASADLYYRCESAWGGTALLGSEGLAIEVHNTGYPLVDVRVRVSGEDSNGRSLFAVDCDVRELPSGRTERVEIASYDLPNEAAHVVRATLASAEFAPE